MPRWRRALAFFRNTFFANRVERELDDELRAYLELSIEAKQRDGTGPAAARRAALSELRGLEQVREQVRDVRAGARLDQIRRDVVYGVRIAARHRGFTIAAVLTLALGIGAATATFTIVDTIVFRPLPYADVSRLVKIWASASADPVDNVSLPEFQRIRDSRIFDAVAADDGMSFDVVTHDGARENADGAMVTTEWLATLGVSPLHGRGFSPEEGLAGRDGVMVLTQDYWRRRFNSDPAIVGRAFAIDGRPSTVVGILPPNVLRYGADFLKPLVTAEYPADPAHRDLDVVGRLRPGATVQGVQAELDVLAGQLARERPPGGESRQFRVMALDKYYASVAPTAARGLRLMLAAVGLLLVIACVNVAGLLTARGAARGRECVIRAALGASRGRLLMQLLVENLLLFVAGGALGIVVAWWTVDAVVALAVAEGYLPQRMQVAIDGRVAAFALAATLAAGLSFGLAPALCASRVALHERVRDGSPGRAGRYQNRMRRALVVGELMLSLVLLVGFGLIIRSLHALTAVGPGFDSRRLLETLSDGGRSFGEAVSYWQNALERVAAMPGVERAAVSSRPPLRGARAQRFTIDGGAAAGQDSRAGDILVSADYFAALRIPVLAGRRFTTQDTASATPVVVVSQTLASRYFPQGDAVGRRVRLLEREPMACCSAAGPVDNVWREIVGVVGDVRQGSVEEAPAATIYRPFTQIVEHDMFLLARVRTDRDMTAVAAGMAAELRAAHPGSEWWQVQSTARVIAESDSYRRRRFVMILLGVFSALAVLVAAAGLYGVMSYFVFERRHDIAVRIALGASRATLFRHVMGEVARLTGAGVLLGCLFALILSRFLSSLLFGVAPGDLVTYLAVSTTLATIAALAAYAPARRAMGIDPVEALKE